MDQRAIARLFDEIGMLLELKGESAFKSNAYYNAARVLEGLPGNLGDWVASGRIREVKGIGQALADKLVELVATGRLAYYEELQRTVPKGLLEMAGIPGMGPKKIQAVWRQLGITTVGELGYACIENRLVGLQGFGQKTQEKIRAGIVQLKKRRGYHLYAAVIGEAERIRAALASLTEVRQAELVGDVRRRMEVLSAVDLLIETERPELVLRALSEVDGVTSCNQDGDLVTAKSAVGVLILVRMCGQLTPHALLAATGSQAHLDALAKRAAQRNVPWDLVGERGEPQPSAESEEALYGALGLPFVAPEMREGLGEIESAETGTLETLVEFDQIQGIFHNHTTDSDGSATLEEMVLAAQARGYRYIGISDHSQSAFYANGLKEDRVREQHAAIDALRSRLSGIAVFKGIEADILADGALDYPDEVLARFDFVIASVHSRFNLPEEEQTARVIRALSNPHVTMLGHPTGRLLLSREGYRIDMPRVIGAARQYGKCIEINANPHRLDLDWRFCSLAKAQGVIMSINPDAHAVSGLDDVQFGIHVARKGGLGAASILNTAPLEDIVKTLHC